MLAPSRKKFRQPKLEGRSREQTPAAQQTPLRVAASPCRYPTVRYPLLTLPLIALALAHCGGALACACEGDDEIQVRNDLEPPRPGDWPDSLVITDEEIELMLRQIDGNEIRSDQGGGAAARDGHRLEW